MDAQKILVDQLALYYPPNKIVCYNISTSSPLQGREREMATTTRAIPEMTLSSGGRIPMLGMGTVSDPLSPPEVVESAIFEAIKSGYRHFDTASIYESEETLGRAMSCALECGLVATRNDFFITSKLWGADNHPDGVLPALQVSLRLLGLEYLDLYLVHHPARIISGKRTYPLSPDDLLEFDMRGTWEAMEECQRLGLTKAIGVSNFTCKKLDQLLFHAKIPPAVNQVEMNPTWQQKKLRDYCQEKNIHVSAFSPLGAAGTRWGSNAVLDSDTIKQVADAKGKTVAQVCLRWAFEQGVSFLPKSFNKERMKENMEIFDWQLTNDELEKLSIIPQQRMCLLKVFFPTNGTADEFWDGEI